MPCLPLTPMLQKVARYCKMGGWSTIHTNVLQKYCSSIGVSGRQGVSLWITIKCMMACVLDLLLCASTSISAIPPRRCSSVWKGDSITVGFHTSCRLHLKDTPSLHNQLSIRCAMNIITYRDVTPALAVWYSYTSGNIFSVLMVQTNPWSLSAL